MDRDPLEFALTNLAATYSPNPYGQVPLAQERFTAGFDMGPGGATPLWPPDEKGQIYFLSELTCVRLRDVSPKQAFMGYTLQEFYQGDRILTY